MTATEVVKKMATKFNMHVGGSTIAEKLGTPLGTSAKWGYLTMVAGGVQGESWFHLINLQRRAREDEDMAATLDWHGRHPRRGIGVRRRNPNPHASSPGHANAHRHTDPHA